MAQKLFLRKDVISGLFLEDTCDVWVVHQGSPRETTQSGLPLPGHVSSEHKQGTDA